MISEVLTSVSINITTFLDVTPCGLVDAYQRFDELTTFSGNQSPSSIPKLEASGLAKRSYLCTDLYCVVPETVILSKRLLLSHPMTKQNLDL